VIHFVAPGRLDQPTGGYRYDARIIAGLRALGRAVRVHEMPGDYPDVDRTAIEAAIRLRAEASTRDICVIDGLALPAFYDLLADWPARKPIALVHHPLGLESGLARAEMQRWLAREAAALARVRGVIVTSEQTRRDLLALGVAREAIAVVNPGTELVRPPARRGRPPIVLTVASLTQRKGHGDALRALAGLRAQRWRWQCVGDAARSAQQPRRLRALIRRFALGRRVRLLGALPHGRLARLYADAALFLLPSRHEGYGMAFAEALAAGLPCVGYRAGAVPDLVPRSAGRLVRVGDIAGLRRAIRHALRCRTALAAGARRAGKRLPDWRSAARGFAAALDRFAK
jgi:glycosyltransferase involved in cell wall biosynthesis